MICFTERKNKQVQYNTEQSFSLIDDSLYINNRSKLKNLDVNSSVFRARRWNIELHAECSCPDRRIATAHVHPHQVPTSDTGTATRCICKQTLIFLLHIHLPVALLQTGFEICALIHRFSPMLPARQAEIRLQNSPRRDQNVKYVWSTTFSSLQHAPSRRN